MKTLLVTFFIGTFVMMSTGIYGVAAGLRYQIEVRSHLQTVATADYPDYAKRELRVALEAIEKRGLNKGSTHYCWKTDQTDLSLWYGQLVELQQQIEAIPTNISFDEARAAWKTILKGSSLIPAGKAQIVEPPMIDVYPHQWTLVAWNIAVIVCAVSLTALIIRLLMRLNPN